jgi:HEAT repeat protein
LSATVNQAELRTRRAALEALIKLNDPRSRPVLEQFMAATHSTSDKLWVETQLRKSDEQTKNSAASVP